MIFSRQSPHGEIFISDLSIESENPKTMDFMHFVALSSIMLESIDNKRKFFNENHHRTTVRIGDLLESDIELSIEFQKKTRRKIGTDHDFLSFFSLFRRLNQNDSTTKKFTKDFQDFINVNG